jgi:hypothetical protein
VALVVNMRCYFAGVLPREIPPAVKLPPLSPAVLVQILDKRLEREDESVRVALGSTTAQEALARLAKLVPTPFAFLDITHYLAETDGLDLNALGGALWSYAVARFASLTRADLESALTAFKSPESTVTRTHMVEASGGEAVLAKLEQLQVVLPVDFWHPTHYVLDPLLHAVHPAAGQS